MPQFTARQAGRTFQACNDCSLTWDRKYNPKDIVLCPLHRSAPKLLEALEGIAKYAHRNLKPVNELAILDIMRPAIAEAKGES